MTALGALTERSVLATMRDGDLLFAILGPIAFFVCFNITLRFVIETNGLSYPQYILPVVVVQAMIYAAMTTADRAARDRLSGMGVRLRTLPIIAVAPVSARMLSALIRAAVALVAAVIVGYLFGFRFSGWLHAVAFVAVALVLSLALSLGADAMGSAAKSVEAAGQTLLVPQLVLVMLSTGLAPAEAFPGWIQPFVRDQPVSQISSALRDLAIGHVRSDTMLIALAWCAGLLVVFGVIAVRMQRRSAA